MGQCFTYPRRNWVFKGVYQLGYKTSRKVKNTTLFRYKMCGVPLCKPSKNECWEWASKKKQSLFNIAGYVMLHHLKHLVK